MIDALTKMDYMLGVMKRQREKLYQDCMNGDYDLMHGLREELPNVYRLSCERYRLMWIDAHWNVVHEFAEKRLSSEKDREALYLYFAKNFRPFIEPLNFSNAKTIEFRLFRGTLKLNTLLATLQMVDKICETAMHLDDDDVTEMSWSEFMSYITEPRLIQYLKERRLYINEEISNEEEI